MEGPFMGIKFRNSIAILHAFVLLSLSVSLGACAVTRTQANRSIAGAVTVDASYPPGHLIFKELGITFSDKGLIKRIMINPNSQAAQARLSVVTADQKACVAEFQTDLAALAVYEQISSRMDKTTVICKTSYSKENTASVNVFDGEFILEAHP